MVSQLDHLPQILDDLERSIQARGLLLAGVDAKGIPRRWEDPAVIDVKLIAQRPVPMTSKFWVERTTFVQYGYPLRTVLSPLVSGFVTDELEDEVRTHIIAGGRRHSMKGDI